MDVETGAMGSLLLKLGDLLADEYKLQAGVKRGVQYLKRELTSVYAALRKVGEVPLGEVDEHLRIRVSKARDVSYRMEDIVDKFVEGPEPTLQLKKLRQLMKKMRRLLPKGEIAGEIENINTNEVGVNSTAASMVDPCPLDQKELLVGIDGSLNEITKIFSDGDGDVSKKLKMLSIIGFGGLGKTTLAKAVYDKLKGQFDCSAFVLARQLLSEPGREETS
ncbi:unnamed protein product [Triticum turgidum subsp. durum]|uniref:Uncharacterized protein n=1 Tax=Triticum turgidum subsp. durum TaxID=4567 RepID=A0A9R0STF6_TRITD|nr:unnamed protein product [Triticum turgidum subsp. durum]